VERWNGGTPSAASTNARTAEAAVCRAAHLIVRHEYLLVAARHAGVMLYDSSLKRMSISTLVASYYIQATERGSATARNRLGCVPTTVQRGQMTVSYRQCYRLSRPLAATAMPGDRVARPATSTARPGRRTTVATASAGTITPMRPRRTRDRTQRTADQPGRTGDRAHTATPPVDAVQASAPLRHRSGSRAFRPVQLGQRLVLHGQGACT